MILSGKGPKLGRPVQIRNNPWAGRRRDARGLQGKPATERLHFGGLTLPLLLTVDMPVGRGGLYLTLINTYPKEGICT